MIFRLQGEGRAVKTTFERRNGDASRSTIIPAPQGVRIIVQKMDFVIGEELKMQRIASGIFNTLTDFAFAKPLAQLETE